MLASVASICAGASAGALLRWLLGTALNHLWPSVPLGTLAANVVGGYLIGLAFAYFAGHPMLSPEWRLLVITGFLGGLTTFSSFSAEVVTLLHQTRYALAFSTAMLHVAGSLLLTIAGYHSALLFLKMP